MNTTPPVTEPTPSVLTVDVAKPRRLSSRTLARLAAALKLLTRFRIFQDRQWPEGVTRESIIWFPFIGIVVGALGAAVDGIASLLGLTSFVTAPLAVLAMIWFTGARHEGGLANFVDGLGGGDTRERKLEIMRDARIGTFGTVTLVMVLIVKSMTMASMNSSDVVFAGLVVAGVWSRVLMPLVAAWLGAIDKEGYGHSLEKPDDTRLIISLIVAVMVTLFLADPIATAMMIGAGVTAALVVALVAKRQLGGFTRDVLGATQQMAELAVLIFLVAAQA